MSDREFLEMTERYSQEYATQLAAFQGILSWMTVRQRSIDALVDTMRKDVERKEAQIAAEMVDLDGDVLDVVAATPDAGGEQS